MGSQPTAVAGDTRHAASANARLACAYQLQEAAPDAAKSDSVMASPSTHVEQLEIVLLRRGLGRAGGRSPSLRGLWTHAADGRAGAPLRRATTPDRLRALSSAPAGGPGRERDRQALRARPRSAPHCSRRLSGSRPALAQCTGGVRRRSSAPAPRRPRAAVIRLALADGPRDRLDRRLRPARAGVRLPAGHRQPSRVHRPLPGRLAPHEDRLRRQGRGRALSREGSRQPLQLGRCDVRRGANARTGSSRSAARARTTASARSASTTSRRRPRARRGCSSRSRRVPVTLSDRLMEGLGARSWLRRKNQRAMHRLRAILERGEGRGHRVTVAGG